MHLIMAQSRARNLTPSKMPPVGRAATPPISAKQCYRDGKHGVFPPAEIDHWLLSASYFTTAKKAGKNTLHLGSRGPG